MNLILDDLPDTLDGVEIQTDFRYWILFEQLMLDEDLSPLQKGVNALNLIYKGTPTATQGTALASLLWFFRCGKDEDRWSRRTARSGLKPRRLYDYDQDAERIFASFWARPERRFLSALVEVPGYVRRPAGRLRDHAGDLLEER